MASGYCRLEAVISVTCVYVVLQYHTFLHTCQKCLCVPVRLWENNTRAVHGRMGTKINGNSTLFAGFCLVGSTGYYTMSVMSVGTIYDGNGNRSFGWARFG